MAEVANEFRNKWHHCPKKHRCSHGVRVKQNQAAADVSPIGIADDDQPSLAEPVSFCSSIDELSQFFRSKFEVLHIKNTLCITPEKSAHSVLQNFATHAKKCCARPQFAPQRQQIILITPGPM